ncbi:hypothetical protein [Spirosoma endbachense]|uniref:Uncharacterized protein n=1 Tax=Spirosoma endbachense TaxID=2666025 RepID=A0A6P1VQ58_9BACT|nr:hypothetical protein [Spirosoma endbachense]QHV94558.1 hypothetical protein GJR95_05800 [Spirosoma endbachense]
MNFAIRPYRHSTSRRIALYLVITFLAPQPIVVANTRQQPDSLWQSIEKAHQEIWRRFVNPQFTILYDYTNKQGTVHIPTAEEVKKRLPNGLSYTTVIEDGAFYNGIYLDGLCERWKKLRTKQTASEARNVANALIKLATVSQVPGFIARNILPDGKTYYPASSDDQTFPWFYGLWKYLNSGIPDKKESDAITKLIVDKATALQTYNWNIPCDPIEFGYYGSFSKAGNKHLVRIPFVTRIAYELTGKQVWLDSYNVSLAEIPTGESAKRIDLLANGIAYGVPGDNKFNFWLSASSQAALHELVQLETDSTIKAAYQKAQLNNGRKAIAHMRLYTTFSNANAFTYEINWRLFNAYWRPQTDCWEARKLGLEQVEEGYKLSPRNRYEFDYMTEPLFAAWVIVLSDDKNLIQSVSQDLRQLLTHYDWSTIYTVPFFIAESVYFEGLKYGM